MLLDSPRWNILVITGILYNNPFVGLKMLISPLFLVLSDSPTFPEP